MNSAIGPYKGGIRFHPSVNLSHPEIPRLRADLQEQPHDAADGRRQGRFGLQPQGQIRQRGDAFLPVVRHRAGSATSEQDTDVPAGDIGVGGREIGFMFGQYKRLRDEFTGTLTGKGTRLGRQSALRPEATGIRNLLLRAGDARYARPIASKARRSAISGSGNVAQYACREGDPARRQGRDALRFVGLRLRPEGHRRPISWPMSWN